MDPFSVTGVDFTGTLYIRTPEGENKVYICLFTCASTRAVQLEVVNDLSEETFMQAFRRFSSRKSLPKLVLSNNASTFMSAADDLKALFESRAVKETLGNQGVEWRFIPRRAPWYGGYWERFIGLTKNALKKTLGRTFVTLSSLVEIEAHLNIRPLTYIGTDLNEPTPLTPSHLLYGRMISTVPQPTVMQDELNDEDYHDNKNLHHSLSKKAKACSLIIDHFWTRWRREYLTSLREAHTNNNGSDMETIRVGDVVIVHDDCPRLKWRLAIAKDLQRGCDGFVRSASIQTASGRTNRPITKLYPLEVNIETSTDIHPVNNNAQETYQQPVDDTGVSSRPTRAAAIKAHTQMTEWTKTLRRLEDVSGTDYYSCNCISYVIMLEGTHACMLCFRGFHEE